MEEISLREIIETVLKGKWLLIAIIIASILVVPLGAYFVSPEKGQASAVISLSFKGIENGLNPDGSKFDINLLTSPSIIQSTIDELKLDSGKNSVDKIKSGFVLDPIVPNNIVSQTEALLKEGKNMNYYPTKYVVTYKFDKSQGISIQTGKRILDTVIKKYQDYFTDLYSDKALFGNTIEAINYDDYDYPEVSDVMNNQLNVMISYLNAKAYEASDFRSKTTGMTFRDMQDSINILKNVDVNKMTSLIYNYNLTKDKAKIISKYEYTIKQNELSMEKALAEAQVNQNLMANYKRQENTLIMPGTEDQKIQLDNNKSYYDDLVKQAKDAGVLAQNFQKDIDYFKKQLDKYNNDTISPEQKKAIEEDVKKLLPDVKNKMKEWIDKVNQTVTEYYNYNYGKSINMMAGVSAGTALNLKLMAAIGFVLGAIIGLFVIFFMEYWKKSHQGNINNKKRIAQNA